jgi:hypothetical protein
MANKEKKYYDVYVEVMLPATLHYRVLAEDSSECIDLIKNKSPNSVNHKLHLRKNLQAKVFDAGSSVVQFIKRWI